MHSPSLSKEQLQRLQRAIAPKLRYFNTLHCRMNQKHFPANDPIFALVGEVVERLEKVQAELKDLESKAIL